jgi:hypothetical protein
MSQSQAQRQQYSNENVATRQQGSTARAQDRQQAAQSYHGGYSSDYHDDNNWDDGEVAAVAVGAAAIGAMAGYASGQANTTQTSAPAPVYPAPAPTGNAGLPCTPNTTVVEGVTYYQCGSSWYTQAYGSNGVIYMPVAPPY